MTISMKEVNRILLLRIGYRSCRRTTTTTASYCVYGGHDRHSIS
jgi:hypothetical protein